jgi:hypothetical protein
VQELKGAGNTRLQKLGSAGTQGCSISACSAGSHDPAGRHPWYHCMANQTLIIDSQLGCCIVQVCTAAGPSIAAEQVGYHPSIRLCAQHNVHQTLGHGANVQCLKTVITKGSTAF